MTSEQAEPAGDRLGALMPVIFVAPGAPFHLRACRDARSARPGPGVPRL